MNQEERANVNRYLLVMKLNQYFFFKFQRTKVQDEMASQMNSTKHLQKSEHLYF